MTEMKSFNDPMEAAIARRLKKLGALPVDTTRMDAELRSALPARPGSGQGRFLRRMSAVAASLLIVAIIGWFTVQGREVQASTQMMAQMHWDIVNGKMPTAKADSIEEANHLIAAMNGNFPNIPQPAAQTMACCMKSIGNKKVACILLNDGKTPVTMAVADASAVKSPTSPITMRNGIAYHIQTVRTLNMVMTERQDRWICLMSEMPPESLMTLADSLKF